MPIMQSVEILETFNPCSIMRTHDNRLFKVIMPRDNTLVLIYRLNSKGEQIGSRAAAVATSRNISKAFSKLGIK